MIKNLYRSKLSRPSAHRKALLRNMATSLFQYEKIQTTLSKARELIRYSEKLITIARPLDLNAQKALLREIKDNNVRKKIVEVLVPRYQNRTGGYAQMFRLGTRIGDRAEMVIVRLIS